MLPTSMSGSVLKQPRKEFSYCSLHYETECTVLITRNNDYKGNHDCHYNNDDEDDNDDGKNGVNGDYGDFADIYNDIICNFTQICVK